MIKKKILINYYITIYYYRYNLYVIKLILLFLKKDIYFFILFYNKNKIII